MNFEGVRIYNEGVGVNPECETKIRKIVDDIKCISPSSDVGMRFVKAGRSVEALLWGNASDVSLGVYNRGPSLLHVLGTLHRKVKKQCVKASKLSSRSITISRKYKTFDQPALDMAA